MASSTTKAPVTMRDVARAAGVSRMTVSRALRKDSPISKETRDRILKVVREMNYVPDQMAGSLTTKKSGVVAVLVPSLNNLHSAETVQALTEELALDGLQIVLGYTNYSPEQEEKQIEMMLRRRPEAIVLSYDGHTERTVELLQNSGVPVIELWERPASPIGHTIGFSNEEAAFQMTKGLISLGYQSITFLAEVGDDWTRGAARQSGYRKAMAKVGMPAQVVRSGRPPMTIEVGAEAVQLIFDFYPETDCVFCVSDAAAFGVQSGLRSRGIDVPGNVGVAGFGDFEVSRFASPSISTVMVDSRRIGEEAARLISNLLSGNDAASTGVQVDVTPVCVMRESTKSKL